MYKFINNVNNIKNIKNNLLKTENTQHSSFSSFSEKITTSSKTVSLFSQPYLDKLNQCYKNIVVINLIPQGPLKDLVTKINFPPLSEFKQLSSCGSSLKSCGFALLSFESNYYNKCDKLMTVDEIPNLISFLLGNGYTIDTNLTKMLNENNLQFDANNGRKLICFITYVE
jgi:hypothetical protein